MAAVPKTPRLRVPAEKPWQVKPEQPQWLESDGEPLETAWHPIQISLLIALLEYHWRERDDFYVAGNTFIYYTLEQAQHILKTKGRTKRFKGPDFFCVRGVPHDPPRRYWVVWEEGDRYPDVIIELLSPTTKRIDRTTKKDLYERTFRTPEYFLFDLDVPLLEGWRLGARGRYREIRPDRRGWMWSDQLGLWLGTWHGTYLGTNRVWLRFYDENGNLLLLPEEAEARRADTEARRADAEAQRADAEAQRARAAEVELARLRALLVEQQGRRESGKGSKA